MNSWKVASISDTHGAHRKVKIPPCDVFIHAGDFTGRDYSESAAIDFLQWMHEQDAEHKVFVPGNHDKFFSKPGWEQFVPQDVHVLINDWVEFFGSQLRLYGSAWTPEFGRWYLTKTRAELLADWRRNAPLIVNTYGRPDILVCHGPPKGILDSVVDDQTTIQVGCEGLREALDILKPRLGIFGHIHEAMGQQHLVGRTLCVNSSFMDEYYCPAGKPFLIQI